ncbi:type II toxin-antitoxin system VapC family toxin [Dolichospermum sp. ST_con]|jgi:PIN domain nuclease of toxin-antitoxin system|nr:type II toxin-antitoxin system VapC family toxin [Dolichospermum sp. ST_con]MDD1421057.1 type II toxin-antitoxin system VapC family toxin [Dolichospermum sp. ST_sed1]MDD1424123.1 type II toxin-antitoxin system VapC family toxin [Dolichospermum sp. ST_sed9]MDD1430614.1 type II toxin-antitoxin system VapC family toxin [Dolichospermum sp. ST_sed6]MDD1435023.1 type II toxin-antitoxin system VapC family toxin [Dolichospermum sp. ST_sed10]MDD1439931.1 type II toxin-antitoxin system VapC family to
MKVLIDTHVFIWWTSDSQKLSLLVYNLLGDSNTQVFLSVVSIWEMQIKLSLGKLQLKTALPELIEDEIKRNRIKLLPLDLSHIYALNNLSNHHRDPFDRLLISQSQSEKLVIVSIDAKFDGYEIERLW